MSKAHGSLWERPIVVGCQAFVESAALPVVQQIMLIDGPAVLGHAALLVNAPGLVLIQDALRRLMEVGEIEHQPIEPLSRIIWSAFFQAGRYIANAKDQNAAQQDVLKTLNRMLTGLRQSRGNHAE